MRNTGYKFGIVWALPALIVIIVVFIWFGEARISPEMVDIEISKKMNAQKINMIQVETQFTHVNLTEGSGDQIEIRLHGKVNATYKSDIILNEKYDGSRAIIKVVEPANYRNLNAKEHVLDVKIPQRIYQEIVLKGTTADFHVVGIQSERFQADTGQGEGTFSNVKSTLASAKSTTGRLSFVDFEAEGSIESNQGSITLRGNSLSKSLTIESNTSTIDLTEADEPADWNFHFQTKQGSIQADISNLVEEVRTRQEFKGHAGNGSNRVTIRITTNQGDIKA